MSPSATANRRTMRSFLAVGLATLISGFAVLFAVVLPTASATHVEPVLKEGNPTCSALAPDGVTWTELKVPEEGDGVEEDGTFTDGTLTVNIINVEEADDGWVFDWDSNIGVDAVFVKGGNVGGNLYEYDPEATEDDGLHAPPNPSGEWAGLSHISFCYDDDPTTPPTPGIELEVAEPICDGNVPFLEYEVSVTNTDDDLIDITWVNPDGDDVVLLNQPLAGSIPWPGAVVVDGEPVDWPGWTQLPDGTWVEGDEFDWVRPSVEIQFEVNPIVSTTVDYPSSGPDCNPPTDTPSPTPSPSPSSIELDILTPVCDNDVPYLEYEVTAVNFTPTGGVTITFINPDGEDVVYTNLPLSGRVLWAGAEVDDEGNPLDWPGWTQLADGTWVEGDEFDWVRPSVEVLFSVNPEVTETVSYPPSSPLCNANPPETPPTTPGGDLPKTGSSNGWLAIGGAGLLAIGAVLVFAGRRFAGQES